ncbi:hypothetical protein Salat_2823400 [Sesamum alatum]|uniref:Uncharacterized protein n=1 Tax=Sesamum alatum TaxID=300844 RepID=A0AAE1XMJ5_9LAMI|nr:hypothetical protein Salat_2823400 [Sesamum alatum]
MCESTELSPDLEPGEVNFFEGFLREPRFQDDEIPTECPRAELLYSLAIFVTVKEKCQAVLFNGVYFGFWWDVPCFGECGSDGVGIQGLFADNICDDGLMGGLVWGKRAKSTINGVGSTRKEGGETDGLAINDGFLVADR